MFESVNATATEYTFVKNPNYWGDAPDVDSFTVKVIPESKVTAMRAGEVSDFDFVTEFITLNDEVKGLDDQNVRTAIQMSIDKVSVADSIYSGLRTPADSVMPSDMPFCKYDTKTPGYDFEGAVKLHDEIGWKDTDGNGVRDKDGTELSYTITYPATGV